MVNRNNPNHWKTEGKGKNPKYEWRRKKRTSSSLPPPSWIELPRDVTANILLRLCTVDMLQSAQVCTTWRSVCQDPAMWRKIDMSNISLCNRNFNAEVMCQHAVDRSRGQLVDIKIGYFCTDELLDYIAERSGQLRCLSLGSLGASISGDSLTEAIQMFPLLEELHLFVLKFPTKLFEIIGRSCPMLKSFTLSYYWGSRVTECDNEALAIAKAMPQLRCLDLFGNTLTNKGLLAILDGCANLESLDLRMCFNVDLGGDLGKRCSQQLKYLRQPYDSTADYKCPSSFPGCDPDYGRYLFHHFQSSEGEDFVDG